MLNYYTFKIREVMNSVISEINDDFTGWCELASMLMFRLIDETEPSLSNVVVRGFYKSEGHFWNLIDDKIVDVTVDQFGKIRIGVINNKWISNYIVKEFIYYSEEDLLHMTEDTYSVLISSI